MKRIFRALGKPLLSRLEAGDEPYAYKPSHRYILVFMCMMFIGLASLTFFLMPEDDYSYLFPVLVFGGAGITGVLVAAVGSDRAVAKIWGSK